MLPPCIRAINTAGAKARYGPILGMNDNKAAINARAYGIGIPRISRPIAVKIPTTIIENNLAIIHRLRDFCVLSITSLNLGRKFKGNNLIKPLV